MIPFGPGVRQEIVLRGSPWAAVIMWTGRWWACVDAHIANIAAHTARDALMVIYIVRARAGPARRIARWLARRTAAAANTTSPRCVVLRSPPRRIIQQPSPSSVPVQSRSHPFSPHSPY